MQAEENPPALPAEDEQQADPAAGALEEPPQEGGQPEEASAEYATESPAEAPVEAPAEAPAEERDSLFGEGDAAPPAEGEAGGEALPHAEADQPTLDPTDPAAGKPQGQIACL